METKKIDIQLYGDRYYIVLSENENMKDEYTSWEDIADFVGLNKHMLFEKIKIFNPAINQIDKVVFSALKADDNYGKLFKIDMISFDNENNAYKAIDALYFEKKISFIERKINELNEKYCSKKNFTREYIESLFSDKYIKDIWEIEKSNEHNYNRFNTLEMFIIYYIEQKIIFDK